MVTLNSHIDAAKNWASNMRLFEATGVGTCLLTDWKPNLCKYFDVDREVLTYKSIDEAREKYDWLMDHPREREMIAIAGQKRTLRDHNFQCRAHELDDIIRRGLKTARAAQ
jgi:spore maturation protein CgeB